MISHSQVLSNTNADIENLDADNAAQLSASSIVEPATESSLSDDWTEIAEQYTETYIFETSTPLNKKNLWVPVSTVY